MDFVAWSPAYELGIFEIDLQHKKLVSLINQMHSLATQEIPPQKIDFHNVLADLADYTVYHFEFEEELQSTNNYPDFINHQKEHEAFKKVIKNFVYRFDQELLPPMDIVDFLKLWLLDHIAKKDKAFAPLLKANGVS